MRLLIVEDEHHVRERLACGIDWASAGIELVDAAGNGREAMAIVRREHLDIIVTDIRMPDMDGLELAGLVKAEYPDVKLIILTGYDDFDYAQKGIEHQVFSYLVKPVTNERLTEVVCEAKEKRERELGEKYKLSMLERRWREQRPRLVDIFYRNWLNGRYSLDELERTGGELGVQPEHKRIWPIVFDMDPIPDNGGRFLAGDRALVQFSLFTLARDVFDGTDCHVLQEDDGATAAIAFNPPDRADDEWRTDIRHRIHALLGLAKDCLHLSASAGVGPIVSDGLLLPKAYCQSRMALQERIVLGDDNVIHFRDDVPVRDSWTVIRDLEKQLEMAIETGNSPAIGRLAACILEAGFTADTPISEAKEMLLRMTCFFARLIHSRGWTIRDTIGDAYDDFEPFGRLLTREQVAAWIAGMSERIGGAIMRRRRTATRITVGEIIPFIREHLHEEELSLHIVAEKLYVNYSYLSRLFKKAEGVSFSDYVLRLRMEKAKELLAAGSKVYETAERVGYRHVNYFSKAFAKYWGVKPSELCKDP